MKFLVALCLVTYWQLEVLEAAKSPEQGKTDKRALVEGNAAVEKRAPLGATASTSVPPGIIYADTKESQPDKSPTQQIYSTPEPQVAKISDVLSGQGPPFPTAIESHLYSPVQVYQQRLGSPTTYEISAPIQSQLAYTEHKIGYQQPQQNSIKFYNGQQKLQPQQQRLTTFARVPVNYPQQQYQQQQLVAYLQQPSVYHQQPQLPVQQIFHYNQFPQQVGFHQHQSQPQVAYFQQYRPGITYADQGPIAPQARYPPPHLVPQVPIQKEVKLAQQPTPLKVVEKSTLTQQTYNDKSQGAVSYASFSQSQPSVNYIAPSNSFVPQQANYAPPNTKLEVPIQNNAPSSKQTVTGPGLGPTPIDRPQVLTYFRPQFVQEVPQYYTLQPQIYPNHHPQELVVQNPGFLNQPIPVSPTFPPVQYFGKFAHSIFGGYQQQ